MKSQAKLYGPIHKGLVCIAYASNEGSYHVDLIGMNGAELPIVEWNGAERCVKVN